MLPKLSESEYQILLQCVRDLIQECEEDPTHADGEDDFMDGLEILESKLVKTLLNLQGHPCHE